MVAALTLPAVLEKVERIHKDGIRKSVGTASRKRCEERPLKSLGWRFSPMISHSRSVYTSGIRCSKRSALLPCKTLRLRLGHQMIGYTMRWTLCCSWCSSMVLVYTDCPQHARG